MAPTPMLDLTSTAERPFVTIDGIRFDLRTSGDLTLEQFRTVQRLGPRLGVLLINLKTLRPEELAEAQAGVDAICDLAFVTPPEARPTLDLIQRMQLVEVFITLLAPSLQRLRAMVTGTTVASPAPRAGSRAGTASSPDSRDSMAAVPPSGLGKPH